MNKEVREKLEALKLEEFLSPSFVRAVLEGKTLSDTQKEILGDKMSTIAFNAINQGMYEAPDNEIPTVGSLLKKTPAELLRFPNFGKKGMIWLETYLDLFELRLSHSKISKPLAALSPEAQEVIGLMKQ